jgi:HEAT repeat protein
LAITALGRLGSAAKSSEAAVVEALSDEEPPVRISAALSLEKIDPTSEQYKPVILKSLSAGDGPVFLEVGRMGGDAKWAVPTLTKLLLNPGAGIRALAARTLGQIGVRTNEAEVGLTRSLRDSDPAVRNAAQQALEKMGQKTGDAS